MIYVNFSGEFNGSLLHQYSGTNADRLGMVVPVNGSEFYENDFNDLYLVVSGAWVKQVSSTYATAAQGTLAASAVQPGGSGSSLTGLTKAQVGLGSADNTSDAGKPVSTAQQAAIDAKQSTSAKGAAGGYAGLDGGGLVPLAQLPGLPAAWGGITGTLSAQTDLQSALDAKQASGSYATGTGSANGTNTGDNATNAQYSGLAASKQDTLVSGTNIKTINGAAVLGSGDLTVSAGDPSYSPGSFTVATETAKILSRHLKLTTTQRATLAGTATLRIS